MDLFDSYIKLDDRSGVKYWRKEEFTRNNWIAHLLDIFNHQSMIATLAIENVSLSYLDTVKQVIPKCNSLEIRHTCSDDVAKMAFFKLSLIVVQSVKVRKNIFRKDNDISKFLTPNLKYVSFDDPEYPFKLISDDLLTLNSDNLSIEPANITEKELNKFLKLWMKRNHTFYRPKVIELFLKNGTEIDEEEVFKGVKYEAKYDEQRLKRRDGKELDVYIAYNYIKFQFK
ncbi:unnamed protein product [Caenorhabditis nigoni]|nr:hypothetical protein B9Z55_027088 [Caenorhabditis nigoni]